MIAKLRGVRERTLSFLEETHGRDLSTYSWLHPFLGYLNFYEWFAFMPRIKHATANKCGKLRKIYQKV